MQKFQDALVDYSNLIRIEPDNPSHYFHLAGVKQSLKQYKFALADYNKAIELDPNNANYYCGRAGMYKNLNQYKHALIDYKKAIELDPDNPDIYRARISVNQELGDFQSVVEDYSELIRLDPNNPSLYDRRARIYFQKLKLYELAADDWGQVIKAFPNVGGRWKGRAQINSYTDRHNDVIDDCNEAIKRGYSEADVYQIRGGAYAKLGQYQKAIDDYKKAKELTDPANDVIIYQIEEMQKLLEEKQKNNSK